MRLCLNVHLRGTSDLGPVLLTSCKIYQVFEVDSGMRLKAAVWLHFFPPLKPNKDHVTVYFSSNLIYFPVIIYLQGLLLLFGFGTAGKDAWRVLQL